MQSEIVEAVVVRGSTEQVELVEAHREIERAHGPTFGEYAERWVERDKGAWSAGSLKAYTSRFKRHVLPKLRDRPVDALVAPFDRESLAASGYESSPS